MLRISDFSKLSGASVKALRYYDQLGLLKPAFVDSESGYRYYSEEQLLTVKRIASFKEQGFTLEDIKTFLEDDVSLHVVKDQLASKKHELLEAISTAQRQLAEVNERLRRVENESKKGPRHSPVAIRRIPPQLVASIRDIVPRTRLCVLLEEVTQYVKAHGETADGSLMILWHDRSTLEEDHEERVELEVAIPLTRELPDSARVKVRLLPEVESAASLVHDCDPYASDCAAIHDALDWASSNGYAPVDSEPIRETYLTPDQDMYGRMRRSELIVPVQNISASSAS